MSTKYPGGFITKTIQAPTSNYETSAAPGIWTLEQAMQYTKAGVWPTAGVPANFISSTDNTDTGGSTGPINFGQAAVDSSNNIYVAGTTRGNGAQDPNPFVAKYKGGAPIWYRYLNFATKSNLAGMGGVATDSSGNVYICGYGDTGGSNVTGAFIQKLDPSTGATVWKNGHQGSCNNFIYGYFGLVVDSSGNSYALANGPNGYGVDVVRYNSSGGLAWSDRITNGTSPRYTGSQLAVDSSGNLYVAGAIFTVSNPQYTYPFLIKYNSSGVKQWMKAYNNATSTLATGLYVAVNSSGTPYCVTQRSGTGGIMFFTVDPATGAVVSQANFNQAGNNIPGPLSINQSTGDVYMASQTIGGGVGYPGVLKLNSSLAAQWGRNIYSSGGSTNNWGSIAYAAPAFSNRYIMSGVMNERDNIATLCTFPSDGSLTGTYGPINIQNYYTISYTYASFTTTTFTDAISLATPSGSNVGGTSTGLFSQTSTIPDTSALTWLINGYTLVP